MTKAQVEAVSVENVKGETLYYLKISAGDNKHFVNVGQKTHDAVKALVQIETTETESNNDKKGKK